MRPTLPLACAAALLLAACSSKADKQADALDNAANQADPAAANVMRGEADNIRDNGSDANLSAPGSPVQDAMSNAGNAAESSTAAPGATQAPAKPGADTQAKPHKAGDTVPPPQTH